MWASFVIHGFKKNFFLKISSLGRTKKHKLSMKISTTLASLTMREMQIKP